MNGDPLDILELEEFYNLMQAYRTEQLDAYGQFEAVKEFIRNHFKEIK